MVRHDVRDYSKENVERVLQEISDSEPVKLNTVVFKLGPSIDDHVEEAVATLVENDVIGCRDSFLKTHINFSPWDTIIYDGIADHYIGINEDDTLYLREHAYEDFDVDQSQKKAVASD